MQRGFTLPLTSVEFWLVLGVPAVAGTIAWFYWATKHEDQGRERDRNRSERLIEAIALILSPVWLALILYVIFMLWRIGLRLFNFPTQGDLRWYAIGFGGLVTGLTALVTAPLALIRVATTERQTRTTEQGHMTDRITQAVEQLGAEKVVKKIVMDKSGEVVTRERSEANLEVRIGGLLSLERIAQDSTIYDKGRDHVRVMEIICAYIRNNAPASKAKSFPKDGLNRPADGADDDQAQATHPGPVRDHDERLAEWVQTLDKPREDIMLALTILGRRSAKQRRIEAAHGQTGVTEADWGFDRPCPGLTGAEQNMAADPAIIARLNARLARWQDKMRNYPGYQLDLRDVCLQRGDFSGFRLEGVRLDGARLEGAILRRIQLRGAELSEAHLEMADLQDAVLEGALIAETDLTGANLSGLLLNYILLWNMDFSTGTNLTENQLRLAFGDGGISLPKGFMWPSHWPEWSMPGSEFADEYRKFLTSPGDYVPPPEPVS